MPGKDAVFTFQMPSSIFSKTYTGNVLAFKMNMKHFLQKKDGEDVNPFAREGALSTGRAKRSDAPTLTGTSLCFTAAYWVHPATQGHRDWLKGAVAASRCWWLCPVASLEVISPSSLSLGSLPSNSSCWHI